MIRTVGVPAYRGDGGTRGGSLAKPFFGHLDLTGGGWAAFWLTSEAIMGETPTVQGSEEFAERLMAVLNAGALALMTSLGHRVGLFDTMASLPAATSEQIAEAAGLNERYVREWLSAMTTGGFVDHDPAAMTFLLPPERAAWLTRAAGPNNGALQAQYIGLLAGVEDQVVDCFRHGGGVPYSNFPKFTALMAEDSGAVHDATLLDVTLPLVPGLVEALERGHRCGRRRLRLWPCRQPYG